MWIKRLLIFLPLLLAIFLLQSYFWVPTYKEQTKGNPTRLQEFITASSGDASILNPVLSSDSASSEINSKVFEGLVDLDEDLDLRGRVAESWEIYEEAYFYVHQAKEIPGLGKPDAEQLAGMLRRLAASPPRVDQELARTLQNIQDIELQPAREETRSLELEPQQAREGQAGQQGQQDQQDQNTQEVELNVQAPQRIKLTLEEVDQDIFSNLSRILGLEYFESFPASSFVQAKSLLEPEELAGLIQKVLPAVEHNPVLVFNLRPDVYFHDGERLTAKDVQFTYQALMDPANLSPRIADFEPVKNVEVLDELTARVTYQELYSPALHSWSIGILPEHLLNDKSLRQEARERGKDPEKFSLRDSRFNRNPVGSGPFKFERWKSDQYIRLSRFENYWEGAPNYKEYVLRIIPDKLTQEMEFYAGTLDDYSVEPHQVERLGQDERFQSFSGTSFGYTYIGYNLRREPFQDHRVRKALSLALDVDKIIEYVLHGQGKRITGPFVQDTEYYDHDLEPLEFDPQKALQILRQAGYTRDEKGWLQKDGERLEFTLITNSGNELRKAILAIVQDSWKDIGVDVHTDTLEWSVFIQERVNRHDFDALLLGWSMSVEPDLYQIFHSSQRDPYELNFVGFSHPEADQLIERIRKEYDQEQKIGYCHRLHEIIARELPYTFLFVNKWTAVLDKRIVLQETDQEGNTVYKPIEPTPTGDYSFYFNKWIKLPEAPEFEAGD
ncbi:MAG: ABC transporter substrate-binding protein [Desulfohalobiaceae bacterium]